MLNISRRNLLRFIGAVVLFLASVPLVKKFLGGKITVGFFGQSDEPIQDKEKSKVYWVKNGNPAQNTHKIIEMMGGIGHFVGKDDIVILKPNAQWWNQGRTNLWAMKGFIDLVLALPGFEGEVIIAENQHFMDSSLPQGEEDNVRGWVKISEINGDINGVHHSLNSLVELYNKNGIHNVSISFLRDGGPKYDVWGNGQNGGIVTSPQEGDGYVWTDNDYIFKGFFGFKKWPVKMTYPIFTSKFSGITVDLKNGAFQRDGKGGGSYFQDKPVKLINFAVLNDHGEDTGITSSIKNYMGITDLSCGYWGEGPEGYFNVHTCGENYFPYAKAGPLGHFMKTVRKADLNIVTAEWVGWGDRIDINKATRMRSVLVSTDPVALDYCGAKHLVLPLSKNQKLHDPDNTKSPIHKFLKLAQKVSGVGNMSDEQIDLIKYDFKA